MNNITLHKTFDLSIIDRNLGELSLYKWEYEDNNIFVIYLNEFSKIFGYKSIDLKKRYKLKSVYIDEYKNYYIKYVDICEVFQRGRKIYLKPVYKLIQEYLDIKVITSSTEKVRYIEHITHFLNDKNFNCKCQFRSGKFLIDIYIPNKNIIIMINNNNNREKEEYINNRYQLRPESYIKINTDDHIHIIFEKIMQVLNTDE